MDQRAEGLRNLTELVGETYAGRLAGERDQRAFGWYVADHAIESCFASVWARDRLDRRSRSMVTIALLIGLGDPESLKTYIRVGLRAGLAVEEIEEIIIQAVPYLGYARAGTALRAAREALKDDTLIPVGSPAVPSETK